MNRLIIALFAAFVGISAQAQIDTIPPVSVPPVTPVVVAPAPTTPPVIDNQVPMPGPMPAPVDAQCATRDDGSSICVNDRVIDDSNQPGTLETIYDDMSGTVSYESGTVNDAIDLQNVSREVQCLYGFCIGDHARDDEGYVGVITDIFENGVAELTYPNGEVWYINLDELDPVQDDGVIITHPWPDPRPYPDTRYYGNCVFPRRPVVIFQVGRRLGPVFPIPPRRIGWHPVPNYPYHPVRYPPRPSVQRPGFPNGGRPNFPPRRPIGNGPVTGGPGRPNLPGNGPGRPNFPGNNGPRPGNPGNNNPGRPNFPGNNGPRPGDAHPGNPGNNGPRPGNPNPGNNGPRPGNPGNNNPGRPSFPGNNGPRPSNPGNNGGGRPSSPPSRPSNPAPSRPSGGGGGGRPSSPPPSRPSGGGGGAGPSRGGGGPTRGPSPSRGGGGGGRHPAN